VDGHKWVEELLLDLPGGQLGFLIVVNILIFLLAFFLDFFELAFIVVPLLGPVAEKLGIDLIFFGILLGINMQTSFMHPPFGFALFYLRSVAPTKAYVDKLTGKLTDPITTAQIYWGAVPYVVIQVCMVAILIAFPQLVTFGLGKVEKIDIDKIQIEVPTEEPQTIEPPKGEGAGPSGQTPDAEEDPGKAIERAMKQEGAAPAPAQK
jgi:GntP family gluconate:H+ symporter